MKRFFAIFLILLVMMVCCPVSHAESGAFLVMDGRTLSVLEEENSSMPLPMASTTKVMTALVVLENASLDEIVEIPVEAVGVEGSSLYIKTGETYTVEQLLYALMLRSANDCAVALAIHAGGSVEEFVDMMNRRASELGAKNTRFENPNGLSVKGHHTTAYELALIMAEAMKREDFRRITSTVRYTINNQMIVNHNKLLSLYSGCIGGKTGYTKEAGRCLVTVAQREGAPLICVTLGRRDDWNIHTAAYEKWFSALETVTFAEKNSFYTDLSVAGGGTVRAYNCDRVTANLFAYDGTVKTVVKAGPFVYGNKTAGDVAGTVEYWYHDVKISESPLLLEQAVETPLKKELFITRIFRFFRRFFLK